MIPLSPINAQETNDARLEELVARLERKRAKVRNIRRFAFNVKARRNNITIKKTAVYL